MKKILAVLLSAVMICSFAVGCNSSPDDSNKEPEQTGEYIIQNGTTEYKVVYPENSGTDITIAISELNSFMKEATGVEFTAVPDASVEYTANSRYISVGNTDLIEAAGVQFSDELGSAGTHIVTKDKSVFLYGETELSSLYAVYDFLEDTVNWDYFGMESYYVDKNVKDIPLKDYNEVNIPDFEFRSTGYGYENNNPIWAKRLRVTHHYDQMPEVNGWVVHNSFGYVKSAIEGHESYWYSDDKNQLCYTAHTSDEDRYTEGSEYLQLLDACAATAAETLKKYPDTHILTMTQQDVATWCGCESCSAVKAEYGSNSACVILFMNDLRAKIDEWFETEDGKQYYRDIDLAFFAYHMTTEAPAHLNGNGEWEANKGYDGTPIHCADGVCVWYAPINTDFMESVYAPINEVTLNAIKGWTTVSDKMLLWFYSAAFRGYMNYYDTFDYMQEYYRLARESGAIYIFDQAQTEVAETAYSWGILKSYLNAKLAWDADADYSALIEKWFECYYGPIAKSMKQLFDYQRIHFNALKEKGVGYGGSTSTMIDITDKFYPKAVLTQWISMYDKVLEELQPLKKTDVDLYETYYTRMATERLSVYYLFITLYEGNTSLETIMQYKLQFKEDAKKLGVEKTGEGSSTISDILTGWGVA